MGGDRPRGRLRARALRSTRLKDLPDLPWTAETGAVWAIEPGTAAGERDELSRNQTSDGRTPSDNPKENFS
ncbi:hypothetical protein [Pseudonocardia parietis]|uniref:hypothetical protein n=1 Tax=Pseudonocardia parietis TaxID=570936 RepID=UPI001AE10B5B|nr:hypothetical protein [Pseudonocardia parietis]